jgi:hypothetical protein
VATPREIREAEQPVRNWQLEATNKQVEALEKLTTTFDTKLDQIITLLNSRPTTAEVDAKIELAVKNAVEKQDLKYSPVLRNNKTLIGLLVATGVGLIASLIMVVVSLQR